MEPIEKDKMIQRPSQAETNYTPLSGNAMQLCSNCRFFAGANEGGPYCHLIEPYPQDIMATGHCDRWETPPDMPMMRDPLPVVIVDMDEVEMALEDPAKMKPLLEEIKKAKSPDKTHTHQDPVKTEGYIAPDSNATSIFKSLMNRLTGGIKPGTSVLKGADGKRMMFIVTSNSYQDRARQWITTEALTEDVSRHWAGDDSAYLGGVQHLFWHWKDLGDIGEIIYSDTWGPFLVELSRELPDPISWAFYTFIENHPEIEWGASQHFLAYKSQDRPGGTFTRILRDETTTLPRENAANLLTFTGVLPVSDKRKEYLDRIIKETTGVENASDLLAKGLDVLKAEMEKTGNIHKSTDAQPQSADFAPLVIQLAEDMAGVVQELDDLKVSIAATTDKQKSLEETQISGLTDQVKTLTESVESIAGELKLAPRSVRQAGEPDGNQPLTVEQIKALREQTPANGATKDSFFGDMDVPTHQN